jgi:putative ABC transport system substrate-binding protein
MMTFRLLGATLPRLKRVHALAVPAFHRSPTVVATRRAISQERGYVFVEHSPASPGEAARIVAGIRNPAEEAIVVARVPGFDAAAFSEVVLRARVPTIDTSGLMKTGSLLSAGMYHPDLFGRLAAIVDQVLRGADPANIPIEQPTHAEVTLDLRTAAAIGVTFPREVLMRATQLIE